MQQEQGVSGVHDAGIVGKVGKACGERLMMMMMLCGVG
jgi:hypothetical protein